MQQCTAYILCTSPRSGSTLLCRMLEATGLCGVPDSHFHAPSVAAWLDDHDMPAEGYVNEDEALKAALRAGKCAGQGATGMFGLRLQRHSARFFLEQLRRLHPLQRSDLARIEAEFGPTRFVYLTRESKLDQAISYIKAQQTGLWHMAPDGREIERLSPPGQPVYDRAAIAAQIVAFEADDRDWTAWFRREEINPLCISYEALARQPSGTLQEVLSYLGVVGESAAQMAPPVARLSDETNRAWAARYRAGTDGGKPQ
jgi:LPS sulfotransferase NodH